MDKECLARFIHKGLAELGHSLNFVWPSGEIGGVHERNIGLYIAHALRGSGFVAFHEATANRKRSSILTKGEIDLIAVNGEKGVLIAMESKRLNSPEKAGEMKKDIERLVVYLKEYENCAGDRLRIRKKYGVVAAMTRRKKVGDWWELGEGHDEICSHEN